LPPLRVREAARACSIIRDDALRGDAAQQAFGGVLIEFDAHLKIDAFA